MPSLWSRTPSLAEMNDTRGPALCHLGVEFMGFEGNALLARMPVDERTTQRFGVLHGGASVFLAESVGSYAAQLVIDSSTERGVGLEINANHVGAVKDGFVIGTATPIHLGRRTHVWSIRVESEAGKLVCISRLTMTIVPIAKHD